jgi:hypothetical protein
MDCYEHTSSYANNLVTQADLSGAKTAYLKRLARWLNSRGPSEPIRKVGTLKKAKLVDEIWWTLIDWMVVE